jgi:hypothetical protein
LLEKSLVLMGLTIEESRGLTAPFVGLNDLRIGDAHIGFIDIDASMSLMGGSVQMRAREAWCVCVLTRSQGISRRLRINLELARQANIQIQKTGSEASFYVVISPRF